MADVGLRECRRLGIRPMTQNMEVGKDTERGFMIVEIAGDNLYFQTISRVGETIDSGTVGRQ